MKLNKNQLYKFIVTERKTNSDGKKFSIITDEFGNTHYYPKEIETGEIDLFVKDVLVNDQGVVKYFFTHPTTRPTFSEEKYEKHKIYPFKYNGIYYGNKERGQIAVSDLDNNSSYYLEPFPWQLSPMYQPDVILCEVLHVNRQTLVLAQSIKNLVHPIFEKNCEYEFKVLDSPDLLPPYVRVLGLDGLTYKLFQFFESDNQTDTVKFTFNGIRSTSGKLIFRQFASFEKIVKYRALKRLTYNRFRDITDNVRITKMFNDYDNKQNLWIISFCNILEDEFSKCIKGYDFEQALIYAEVLIEFENWILKSGFLETFSDNKEIIEVNKIKLIEFETKKHSLELILNDETDNNVKRFIKDEFLTDNIHNIIFYAITFNYGSDNFFNLNHVIEFYIKLGLNNFFKKQSSENYAYCSFLNKLLLDMDKAICEPLFANAQKRDKYFIGNNELEKLIKLLAIQLLIYKDFGFDNTLLLTRFLRYKSLFENSKNNRLYLIKTALHLAFNNIKNEEFSDLFHWTKFQEMITMEAKKFNYKNDIKKSATISQIIKDDEEVIAKIINENVFGYELEIFNNRCILPKKSLREIQLLDPGLNPSREILVNIKSIDEYFGNLLVSHKRLSTFQKHNFDVEIGQVFDCLVTRIEEYGAFVEFNTVTGLLHKNQLEYPLSVLRLGETLQLQIVALENSTDKTLISLSSKSLLETSDPVIGKIYKGYINAITPIGIFINTVCGLTGLVRRNNISHQHYDHNFLCKREELIMGELIRISDDGKLEFSLISITVNPFKNQSEYLEKKFEGQIYEITKQLLYVKFNDIQLTGYCHISLEDDNDNLFYSTLKVGSSVVFKIARINPENLTLNVQIDIPEVNGKYTKVISTAMHQPFNYEIAHCFEHFAYLLSKNSEKLNYLNWAKNFYGISQSPKSYYLDLFVNYQGLINNMHIGGLDESVLDRNIEHTINQSSLLINEINEQNLTTQIFPTLNLIKITLQIISYFGSIVKDEIKFLFDASEYDYDFDIIEKCAKLVLSYNLLTPEYRDENLKFLRWKQLNHYLKEGLIIVENEDENDIKQRTELFRIIKTGENNTTEFKASLFKPVHDNIKRELLESYENKLKIAEENNDKEKVEYFRTKINEMSNAATVLGVKHTAMKSLVAFANSNGGNLIIGLEDDLNMLGLEFETGTPNFDMKSQDRYLNSLDVLVTQYIGNDFHHLISSTKFIKSDEKHLLWITVKKSTKPIFLRLDKNGSQKKEFYIRARVSSTLLDIEEFTNYYNDNFSM